MSDEADPFMARVVEAIGLSRGGEQEEARRRFAALWDELGPDGDPFHRVTVAHFAADVEPEVRDELEWDLRALAAADLVTDERAREYDRSLRVAGFYPSLHASLADDYLRLGDRAKAREHLRAAQDREHTLNDDEYGAIVRAGIARVRDALG